MSDDSEFVLQNQRRREILEVLSECEEISIARLSDTIINGDESPVVVVSQLYDCHLPRLADAGLLEYAETTGDVSLAVPPEEVEQLLS